MERLKEEEEEEGYDITPDQVYLRRNVAVQTDHDIMYEEASCIVDNFHAIETKWKRIDACNSVMFCFCCLSLMLIIRKL